VGVAQSVRDLARDGERILDGQLLFAGEPVAVSQPEFLGRHVGVPITIPAQNSE
jgi:hypothetical protein